MPIAQPFPAIARTVQAAYEGGLTVQLVILIAKLPPDGIPQHVRKPPGVPEPNGILLVFDAPHNHLRNASFEADAMYVDMSFDRVYPGCRIPWDAVLRMVVNVEPEPEPKPKPEPEPEPETFNLPGLKLVH